MGIHPVALAYDNSTKNLYVSNIRCASFMENYDGNMFTTGNISVINTVDNKVTGSITVQRGPRNMFFDRYNNILYVSNEYSHSITLINTYSNTVIKNISLGSDCCAEDIILDKFNNCIYALVRSGCVCFINPVTEKYTGSVPTYPGAWGAVYDSDNNLTYVLDSYAGKICIMSGNYKISNITGLTFPVSGVFIPKYNYIYVTSSCSNTVYVINANMEEVSGRIIVKSYPEQMAYDNKTGNIYIANKYAHNVLVMNSTDKIIDRIHVGNSPDNVIYDWFNNYIYVANRYSNNITIINGENNRIQHSIHIPYNPDAIFLNRNNKDIYVLNYYSNNVTVINTGTEKYVGNVSLGASPREISLDTENDNMYITTNNASHSIYIVNSNNRIIRSVNSSSYLNWGIVYDKYNNLIYISNPWERYISVFNPDTDNFTGKISISHGFAGSMLLDPYNHLMYVTSCNNLISINTSSGRQIKSIGTGKDESSAIYVAPQNAIYVSNSRSGTVSKIQTNCYNVTFIYKDVNLTDRSTMVTVNNHFISRYSGNKLILHEPNGTYTFSLPAKYFGQNVKSGNGTFNISGNNVIITVTYRNYFDLAVFFIIIILASVVFISSLYYFWWVDKLKKEREGTDKIQ